MRMPPLSSGKKGTRSRSKRAARAFTAALHTEAVHSNPSAKESTYIDEEHPTGPFMHAESCVLVCGSFPPVKKSVKFYYPNANNDMWRVLGEVFFHDQTHFYTDVEIKKPSKGRRKGSVRVARCLNEAEMRNFVVSQPIGFFDVCKRIRRQRGNSSDNNIETLERTDVFRDALTHTPHCEAIITTGTLALTMLLDALHTCGSFVSDSGEVVKAIARNKLGKVTYSIPRVGGKLRWAPNTTAPYHRALWIYRAPSTSRALPLKLADKIALYRTMFAAHLHLA